MNYKNIFAKTALVALLAAPGYAFSAPVPAGPVEGETSGFYASLAYKPAFENFGDIEVVEPTKDKIFGYKSSANEEKVTSNSAEPYKPKYKPSYLGGGVALGYAMGNARVEIAGSYAKFDIEDKDFTRRDFAKEVVVTKNALSDAAAADTIILKNDAITTGSIMANAYYDIVGEGMPVVPYIGAGVGMDIIKAFNKTRYAFAYQGKVGLAVPVTPQISIIAAGFYHGVLGDEFKELKGAGAGSYASANNPDVKLKMPYSHYGLEAGVRVTFN